MGHHIQGIISQSHNINKFAQHYSLKKCILLNQGFSLLMLSDDDLDSFIFSANYDRSSRSRTRFSFYLEELRV